MRVAGEPLRIDTIVEAKNFRNGIAFEGGRKLRHWSNTSLPGFFGVTRFPQDAPEYDTVYDFLPHLETLCPITDEGVAARLEQSFTIPQLTASR